MADNAPTAMAKRQVAFKVRISDILNNQYVKEEGWLPNYVEVGSFRVSRVNIVGVIVSKSLSEGDNSENFVLEDGTGRVPLRFFNSEDAFEVGDVVLVIGRPREFGSDRYIVPEVMKRVKNALWIDVRKRELALNFPDSPGSSNTAVVQDDSRSKTEVRGSDDDVLVGTEEFTASPKAEILDVIRRFDGGSGVSFEEVCIKCSVDDVESWMKKIIESGDVFEVRPGRYKLLE